MRGNCGRTRGAARFGLQLPVVGPLLELRLPVVGRLLELRLLIVGPLVGTCLLTVSSGQAQELERYEYAESVMGTEFRVLVYARDARVADNAAAGAFSRARELDSRLSDWISESELNQLSSMAGRDTCTTASADLLHVLNHAQHVSEATEGSFDVTVGPLTRLWRRAMRRGELPSNASLQTAREAVGYRMLTVDPVRQCVSLSMPDMRLDLGGIAKGYAADEMLKTMRSYGLSIALVDAGGDIVVGEAPPGNDGWRVRVSTLNESGELVAEDLAVSNAAVASSGDRYRYLEVDGVRYSHILDPSTGHGITVRRVVTVLAPSGIEADALASAISVMGEKGLRLAERPGRGARLVELTDTRTRRWETSLLETTVPRVSEQLPAGGDP